MLTIHALVAAARHRLSAAGIAQGEADLDARLLLQHVLGWDAAHYFSHGDQAVTVDLHERYDAVVSRRCQREPMAYVTGVQEFWTRPFDVSPAVLIPRPETEQIIEIALALPDGSTEPPERIADVCTGSGCLAVTLALERPRATVVATDISPAALAVARRNAARHTVNDRVQFVEADLLTGVIGSFDLIVANPPYIPAGDERLLQPEVVEHEPHLALFAGADGLSVIGPLVRQAAGHLTAGGHLIFEFGYGQADAVVATVGNVAGLHLIEVHNDLQGIPRIAVARRPRADWRLTTED